MKKSSPTRNHGKYATISNTEPYLSPTPNHEDEDVSIRDSNVSSAYPTDTSEENRTSTTTNNFSITSDASSSPFAMSPWNNTSSSSNIASPWNSSIPIGSPWSEDPFANDPNNNNNHPSSTSSSDPPSSTAAALVGSLVREEGHIYSLAAFGDLLYTGSDSKNVRVWKNQKDHSGFKSTSGLVKSIVISSDHRVFTGHQDGKIRVWRVNPKNTKLHKRVGTLPKLKDFIRSSMKPSNYVESRRKHQKSGVWIKHSDAISTLSISEDQTLLYSGSWDRTVKVWRISDSKCMESINAHDDAVNAVANGFGDMVFTGSADGTVKVWRREAGGKGTTMAHKEVKMLLQQESAVTSLAVNRVTGVVYSGSSDGAVNLWEEGLVHGGVLRGHKLAVLCLAAAGGLLFSGSADKNICIWGRDSSGAHACLSVLTGHGGPVKCLAVEADAEGKDGKTWVLYSGSLDKSVKIWKVCDNLSLLQQRVLSSESSSGPPKYDAY